VAQVNRLICLPDIESCRIYLQLSACTASTTSCQKSMLRGDTGYLALSGSADPLSGSLAFSVLDCAASSRTLARIG